MTTTGPRDSITAMVEDVAANGGEYVITRDGRKAAIVLGYDEYRKLVDDYKELVAWVASEDEES